VLNNAKVDPVVPLLAVSLVVVTVVTPVVEMVVPKVVGKLPLLSFNVLDRI
jgi:hypothetical protein